MLQKIVENKISKIRFLDYLSLFFDVALSTPFEENQRSLLSFGIKLLAFVSQKDLFFQNYARQLAIRLLCGKIINLDLEMEILNELETSYKIESVGKLIRMIIDIKSSNFQKQSFSRLVNTKKRYDCTV